MDRDVLDHRWRRDFGLRGDRQQRGEKTVALLGAAADAPIGGSGWLGVRPVTELRVSNRPLGVGRQTPDEPFRNAIFPVVLLGSERVYRSSLIVWSDSMRDAMDLDADLAERLCVFISPREWQNGALGAIQSSNPSAVA